VGAYDAGEPTSFGDLVNSITYDLMDGTSQTLEQILVESTNPSLATLNLSRIVESHLFKRMYEILANLTLMDEKIQINPPDSRSATIKKLTPIFVNPLKLPPDFTNEFFVKAGTRLKMPNSSRYEKLIQPKKTIIDGIDAWLHPDATPAQLESIYELFSTKPFYADSIRNLTLARCAFDGVFAVMVDIDNFEPDPDGLSRRIGDPKASDQRLEEERRRLLEPTRFNIDALYVNARLETT
jgi:hypothetical protein